MKICTVISLDYDPFVCEYFWQNSTLIITLPFPLFNFMNYKFQKGRTKRQQKTFFSNISMEAQET